MSIMEGLAATKATLDLAQKVTDLVKRPNIDAADVQAKLHELLIHAVNAQAALAGAQIEMSELRSRLDDRDALKAIAADLEMDVVSRYLIRKSERERGLIPYCPTCWGSDSKLIPLALVQRPGGFACPIHKMSYKSEGHLEAEGRAEEEASRRRRQPGDPPPSWMAR
jgi:hypothetical protein